jgi:NADP-dependent 3-hydroxy acid dehydrogenase YdfG
LSKSMAVFGAGPGLGQAIAHRYARAGYDLVLVGRRPAPLEQLAGTLSRTGVTAHPIAADLSDIHASADLIERIRDTVGDLDAFYYASNPGGENAGFTPAVQLTPEPVRRYMPLAVYTLLTLVQAFIPHMIEQGEGAILVAQGAAALGGRPGMSGPGLALAAQRNYLQSLQAEVADKGVVVARIYIAAAIENTPFHARQEAAKASGAQVPQFPTVNPDDLAELLWTMHHTRDRQEATYPETLVLN